MPPGPRCNSVCGMQVKLVLDPQIVCCGVGQVYVLEVERNNCRAEGTICITLFLLFNFVCLNTPVLLCWLCLKFELFPTIFFRF